MIQLNVLELLRRKGKTKYWLYKQMGMSYQSFHKMVNNETRSVQYKNLETLCLLLSCTPNELLVYVDRETGQKRPVESLIMPREGDGTK